LFSNVVEYAHTLLAGQTSAKYPPIEVAHWIEDCIVMSTQALDEAHRSVHSRTSPAFRRIEEDVLIQIGLGSFFAHKLRSAVLYEIFQQTGSSEAGDLAVTQYQNARDVWAAMADRAKRVYRADVSYGIVTKRRGHWSDRLAGIDLDLTAMKAKVKQRSTLNSSGQNAADAIKTATSKPQRPKIQCMHTVSDSFIPGQPLSLALAVSSASPGFVPKAVRMFFRHVDQAERWTSIAMHADQGRYQADIPAEYTKSDFGLQYYFAVEDGKGLASMYPGFNKALSNQPYFAVCKRRA
jgi:hypothetical protein